MVFCVLRVLRVLRGQEITTRIAAFVAICHQAMFQFTIDWNKTIRFIQVHFSENQDGKYFQIR